MLEKSRQSTWESLKSEPFDLVVIGGGITGAGILREAQRAGWRSLLLEAKDYAWGTSSRSSKMVHGGLRYLAQGQFNVMFESVRERERLLKEASGLVDPLGFLIPVYDDWTRLLTYQMGLTLYGLCAGHLSHKQFSKAETLTVAPTIKQDGLIGAFLYQDAQTDDARLVLRLIKDAVRGGASALNYTPVRDLLIEGGSVKGVKVEDVLSGEKQTIKAAVVVNATGANTDALRSTLGAKPMVRPLRGSHLAFTRERLPLTDVVAFSHPTDNRNVFAYPWRDHILVGTTDLDEDHSLDLEPQITKNEVEYLMTAAHFMFPGLDLKNEDITAVWAGVRPVIGTGKADPSKESRDSVVLQEKGMISVSGGKLTTFRATAQSVLREAAKHLGRELSFANGPLFEKTDPQALPGSMSIETKNRLAGFYGVDSASLLEEIEAGDLEMIAGTKTLKSELKFSSRFEDVCHLEDLMLRRARFGFVLPEGGKALLGEVRDTIQDILAWTDERWDLEEQSYLDLIAKSYSLSSAEK